MGHLAFTFVLAALSAQAMAAGDAREGKQIAAAWCSGCHAVGSIATDAAPPLAAIARKPDRTAEWLHAWLTDPHPPMPRLDLSRQDIANIIAYLDSLEAE